MGLNSKEQSQKPNEEKAEGGNKMLNKAEVEKAEI